MRIVTKLLVASVALTAAFNLFGQTARTGTNMAPPRFPDRMMRPDRPQAGKVVAVDKDARTVMIGPMEGLSTSVSSNVVLQVATNAVILKSGKRATLGDVTTGEPVRFRSRPIENGKQAATFLIVGNPTPRMTTPPVRPGAPAQK